MIDGRMTGKTDASKLATTLRAARDARGLSRRELAVLAETTHQTVRAFEMGGGRRLDILLRIAGRLGLELDLR